MKEGNVKENKQVEEAMKTLESSVSNAKLLGRNLRITLTSNVLEIALNYIKELEEEIEVSDDLIERHELEIENLKEEIERYNKQLDLDYVDNNFINKQVIRDKIEEIEKERDEEHSAGDFTKIFEHEQDLQLCIDVLKELLEEE